MANRAAGHLWTVAAVVWRTLFPARAPQSQLWSTTVEDPKAGSVVLTGRLSRSIQARGLVILVHGLGGSSESGYLKSAACAADALGLASLRLNLRGADGETCDFYHGGLTDDLHAAVSSAELRPFERVFLLGFSMGGHIALRFATEAHDRRVAAVAAVCSPLDLAAAADAFDVPWMAPYRNYVMRRLRSNYRKISFLGTVPTPPERTRAVRTIRQWDSLTVVPRFDFEDPDDYYSRASVASRLDRLRLPALLLAAEDDPIIPPAAIQPGLASLSSSGSPASDLLTVRWLGSGGHLGFPLGVDLGTGRPKGYLPQILLWLLSHRSLQSRRPKARPG